MSLLSELKLGRENRTQVCFPGTDQIVDIRLLSNQDMMSASMAADKLFSDAKISVSFQNVDQYEAERTVQQLYRALRIHGTDSPIADTITQFRELVTVSERGYLVSEYNALDSKCNPSPETMTDEEWDSFVFEVKKKPSETIGNCSNLHMLRRLSLFLAEQQSS